MKRLRIRTSFAQAACAALLLPLAACGGPDGDGAPDPTPTPKRYYDQYVALGDSYTSAPLVGTVGPDDLCIRSGINYPALVARSLGASLLDRSCSAADLTNLQEPQDVEGTAIPPQLEAVTPRTDLVTIGMGGNPAATQAWFATCPELRVQDPEGAPCRAHFNRSGKDRVLKILRNGRKQLVANLELIRTRAPEARVLVIGYPAIFPDKGSCPDLLDLARGDVRYAGQLLRFLNKTLAQAAETAGAEYVDVYAATQGHDICAAEPWIQGKEAEAGVALSYHPRAAEQRAVAELLIRTLR